ncbi:MAG: group 1 truncated hemoglobin [Chitinophagaceae bacterium]|nr:MAG: group 1 truncated hemoglobin [Chitinophagaceae bacterium]
MRKLSLTTLSLLFAFSLMQKAQAQESLYKRIGGYDAMAAVTDDFIGRLATDKDISRFFIGQSDDSKARIRIHIINMICMATDGPCNYTGRDMKTSHKGLGITEADWNTMAGHFVATLNKFKVPKKEQDELLAIVGTTKKDIVEKN